MYFFLISFKKEHLSKKILLMIYCKQIPRPHALLGDVTQIAFLNLLKAYERRASLNRNF